MPQPGYINTPYGPVPISELGKGPTLSETTAKSLKPGQVVGGYIDYNTGLCRPIIPNPIVKTSNGGGGSGNGGNNNVKIASTSTYVETVLDTRSDLSIEERIAFMSLTSNEILQVLRNFDMSSSSLNLNKNVLDSTAVVNAINPIQIIKMANSNVDYLSNSTKTIENTQITQNQTTGTTTISAPASSVAASPTISNVNSSATSTTPPAQIQVQVQTPQQVVAQPVAPPHKILSISPTSAKRGATITVTHEKCIQPMTLKIGTVTRAPTQSSTKTIKFKIPTATSGSSSLAIGSSYKVYVTINEITVESDQSITILA